MSGVEIIEKELSYTVMQAAFEVHNTLGPGFPEKIYEGAMARELSTRGVEVERQIRVVVYYKVNHWVSFSWIPWLTKE